MSKRQSFEDWRNHPFLQDPDNRDEMGAIKDGSVCPNCRQPRPGTAFLSKKTNQYLPACLGCRRKANQFGWESAY